MTDEFPIEIVRGKNGKKLMVTPGEAEAIRAQPAASKVKSPGRSRDQGSRAEWPSLRDCDSKQTGNSRLNRFFSRNFASVDYFYFTDTAAFEFVKGNKGVICILSPEEAESRKPKPPRKKFEIKGMLQLGGGTAIRTFKQPRPFSSRFSQAIRH